MAFKLIIPGADFSALGNPKVEDYIEGLPAPGLEALYLFSDGTVGQAAPTTLKDYSGKGNDAALVSGSNAPVKSVGGFQSGTDTASSVQVGYGFLTPVPLTDRFTIAAISRNLYGLDAGSTHFMGEWMSSGNFANPNAPVLSTSNAGAGVAVPNFNPTDGSGGGILQVNRQVGGQSSASNLAEVGIFNVEPDGTAWRADNNSRPTLALAGSAKNSWMAWALAFDKTAGAVLRFNGISMPLTDAASISAAAVFATAQIARGAKHIFGGARYNMLGFASEMAMAAVYKDVAKSAADLDALLAAMKARLAPRLGTGVVI